MRTLYSIFLILKLFNVDYQFDSLISKHFYVMCSLILSQVGYDELDVVLVCIGIAVQEYLDLFPHLAKVAREGRDTGTARLVKSNVSWNFTFQFYLFTYSFLFTSLFFLFTLSFFYCTYSLPLFLTHSSCLLIHLLIIIHPHSCYSLPQPSFLLIHFLILHIRKLILIHFLILLIHFVILLFFLFTSLFFFSPY